MKHLQREALVLALHMNAATFSQTFCFLFFAEFKLYHNAAVHRFYILQ